MIDTCKQLLADQFDAAFCTMSAAIKQCPDECWDEPIVNLRYCQVVFHTLFFADYYLGKDIPAMKAQAFHVEHPDMFRDYEEIEDRRQQLLYTKPDVKLYLQHCRDKAANVLAAATADSLAAPCGVRGWAFSWAELHVRNIRHIQHHAAQLGLVLRMKTGKGIPWFGKGWSDG